MLNNNIKNSMLNSLLSFMNFYAFDSFKKDKEDTEIKTLVFEIQKHYKKFKMCRVSQKDDKMVREKLENVNKVFQDRIFGDKDETFQGVVFSVIGLDYMLKVERDTALRVKFGHINTKDTLAHLENDYASLYAKSIVIFNELVDLILDSTPRLSFKEKLALKNAS